MTIPSPCVKICILNKEKICKGCGRTIKEIQDWSKLTDKEKREVLNRIQKEKQL